MQSAIASSTFFVPEIDHIPTDEDWNILLQKARDLEARIQTVQEKQSDYNQVLERCYVVEEAQRLQMAELHDRIRKEEIDALTNPDFARWFQKQDETIATDNDMIGNWYHDNGLLALTPFFALVPFPRYLTEKGSIMCEEAINKFQRSPFYITTVPVKSSITLLSHALMSSATHLHSKGSEMKSDLGPFSYLTFPQYDGTSAIRLVEKIPTLKEGLSETNCLLLNDHLLAPHLIIKCLVVRGRCTVAELSCPFPLVPLFQRGSVFTREQVGNEGISSPLLPHDIIAYALGAYVKSVLTPLLKERTYEAILIGHIKGWDMETDSKDPLAELVSHLSLSDLAFQILNLDYPDNSNFDMFSAEDVRHISGYVLRRDQHGRGLIVVPPAIRMVELESVQSLSPTVALLTRQLEKSAERYKAYCAGDLHPAPICSIEFTDSAQGLIADEGMQAKESDNSHEVVSANSALPKGRLSAAHMDPFMNVRTSNSVPYLIPPGGQSFFPENEAIHQVLAAQEEINP